MTAAEKKHWEVTGALAVAPLSIQCARDLLIVLASLAMACSMAYLGLDQALTVGLGGVLLIAFALWRVWASRKIKGQAFQTKTIRISALGLDWVESSTPLILRGVVRHWAGVTLLCQTPINNRTVKRRLTLWRDHFAPDDYRRLSVLLNILVRVKT